MNVEFKNSHRWVRKGRVSVIASWVVLGSILLTGCGPVQNKSLHGGLPPLSETQFHDYGPRIDRERVKLAAQAALSAQLSVASVDPTHADGSRAEFISFVRSDAQTSRRLSLLKDSFAAPVATDKANAITLALLQNAGTSEAAWSTYKRFRFWGGARMVVSAWKGVRLTGQKARVSLTASERYYMWSGKLRSGDLLQIELLLHKTKGAPRGWVVEREVSDFVHGAP